jgi:tetratricopeptide (TPR) repeat protein/tRNA A-37 threonylcarbamoyl transferase component Bud32
VADPRNDDGDASRPSFEQTEFADDRSGVRPSPVRVAAIDAEHMRNAVAARLFGAAADPVKIDRFTVLKRLGAGGMGVVYSAYDERADRKIAIKLLRGVEEGADLHRQRLSREAQALGKLSHPNVVILYDVGEFRGQVYVAMEFIDGVTLRDWKPTPGIDPVPQILEKFIQAGQGLAAAHAAGLVHRDFKPDNALVGTDGRVRVLDFGLARGLEDAPEPVVERTIDARETMESSHDTLRQPLTRTGAILGTPAYMAPEQHMGLRADARSDQFSFCVALWEKLYGDRPFRGRDIRSLALAVTDGEIQEPSNARAVPQWIRRALERGLSVAPEKRWPDMPSLLAALTDDPRKRQRGWIAGIAGALILGTALTFALTREPEPDPCEGGDRLAGVWDDDVRERVHSSFTNTGVPYAEEAWTETSRLLDAYAQDWIAMDREICRARASEHDTELVGRQMVCIGQRRTELEKLIELLVSADDDVVSRAVVAAGSLSQIASCADERALVADSLDPEQAAELDRLLASVSGRKALGKYDEGLEIAEQAVAKARELDTAHGEGRALLLLGDLQVKKRRNLGEAKATLREALRRADVARDDATRVQALTQLMRISYLEHDLESGEVAAADARAALDRLGDTPLLEADFYLHYGSLALARGDHEKAAEYHRLALSIRAAQLGEDHPEVAISLINIANALIGEGDQAEAEQLARRAQAIFEKKFGANHPYTASSHNVIGNSLLERGRKLAWDDPEAARPLFLQAVDNYLKAIAIREANLGSERQPLALSLHNLGEARWHLGLWEEARSSYERSLAIKLESYAADNPTVLRSGTGLGRALLELGKVDEAVRVLETSIEHIRDREVPADVRGERAFALARALTKQAEGAGDPAVRAAALDRARELADQAAAAFGEVREEYAGELRDVDRWRIDHPASPP